MVYAMKARGTFMLLCVSVCVDVWEMDGSVAAFRVNTELWGEMYIGILPMDMGIGECSILRAVDNKWPKLANVHDDPGT